MPSLRSLIFDLFPVALVSIAAAIARDNFAIVRETLIFGINGSHLRFALIRLFPHWFSLNRTTRRPAEQCDERRFLSARSLGTSAVTLLVSTSVYGVNVYGTRAEPAYHCSPGQIYRVSKNICVPKQSAMSLQNGSSTGEGKPATEKTSSGLRGSVSGARNAEHAPRISSPSSPAKVGEPAADVSSGTQSRMSGAANASRTPRVSMPHRSGREGAGRRPTAEDSGGAQVRGAAGVSVAWPDAEPQSGGNGTARGLVPTAAEPDRAPGDLPIAAVEPNEAQPAVPGVVPNKMPPAPAPAVETDRAAAEQPPGAVEQTKAPGNAFQRANIPD